jgi:hypothetical protein
MATASLADTSLVNQPSTANQSSAPNLIRFCEGWYVGSQVITAVPMLL